MGPKVASHTPNLQDQFGIRLLADGQPEIDVEPCQELGLDKFRVVFDPESKKWKVSLTRNKPATNGVVTEPQRPKVSPHVTEPSWVDNLPNTDHVKLLKRTKWSETPLGPLESWSVALRAFTNLVMAESKASVLYWGPDLLAIGNAQALTQIQVRLNKGDNYMGRPCREIFPDKWHEFGPALEGVMASGVSLNTLEVSVAVERGGSLEETFWNGSFVPVRDPEGKVRGILNRAQESTKEVITARRTKTLNAIALPPDLTHNSPWKHLFNAFRENDHEFPMAFVYKATMQTDTGITLHLEQSIGLPSGGHPLVPEKSDLFEGHSGFASYFRKAKSTDRPLLLHKHNGSLPDELTRGFEWKGYGEPSSSLAIIAVNSSDRLLGLMVMGLNPRRPYDTDYEGFILSLARHVSSIITNAVDQEEARLRNERLSMQLVKSEKQIREIAEHGPVGMVQVALNGKIEWANDQFYELTGHSSKEEDQYELSFLDVVDPRDQDTCAGKWAELTEQRVNITCALRLKRTWKPPASAEDDEHTEEPVWVTASAYPITGEGEVRYIAAAVTDISYFKWAEAVESRNAAAAREAKRLQENFIDIVSHEMRNPLSAITQLADGISTSLDDAGDDKDLDKAQSILEYNVESAKTILLCASHQKRIIDDVLTLSKLDSMMLSITPVVVQPRKVVEGALKMFEGEFQTNNIKFESIIDSSYAELKVDWMCLDPSRLTQIFINLITNAIKFTRLEDRRQINVRTSATLTKPPTLAGVTWFPTHKQHRDPTQGSEWGHGQEIYLCFQVQDTGRGLEQEEMKKLFGRFQQATAKTHIKYGGSGLGLFISRELTETQAGEIGVVSEPGKGSTFAFYIKSRRANPPDDPSKAPAAPPVTAETASSAHTSRRLTRNISQQYPHHGTDKAASSNPVILLVEDNVVNAKVLTRQLERANCEVHIANHGMEAIDFLSKTRAWKGSHDEPGVVDLDCILMDVEMPIMDGMTCTRRIRQLEKEGMLEEHIGVIAITANARPEQIDTVMHAGADDVMPKPFRVKELLDKVDLICSKRLNGAVRDRGDPDVKEAARRATVSSRK